MNRYRKKIIVRLLGAALLLVIANACQSLHVVFPEGDSRRTVLSTVLFTVRNVIFMGLLAAWCQSLYARITHIPVRRLMLAVGALLAFWLFIRHCKFEYTMSIYDVAGRYIWYGYYIPMVMVPLLGVFIVDHIGKPEGYRSPWWMGLLYIPAFAMILAVLTNDLHQQVFRFPEGFYHYDKIYTYRWAYFIIMAWFVLLGIYFVVSLIRKSRVPGSRKLQILPLLVLGGALIFWTLYCLDLCRHVDLTAVDCIIIVALLESAIQSGLIPVNSAYGEVFRMSTAAMQIVDTEYRVRYASASAADLSPQEMAAAEQGAVPVGSTLLRSRPVTGGHALWQDEVSQIRTVQKLLQDSQSRLQQNNHLLRSEVELKRQQAQLDEQNRLYDRIAREVAPQAAMMEVLLDRLGQEPERKKCILTQLCVITTYIKRHGNLLLLAEENRQIPARELEYCIRETLDNLRSGDLYVSLQSQCEGDLELAAVMDGYECFSRIVEQMLEDITAIFVRLSCKNGRIRMVIQIGCSMEIPRQALEAIRPENGRISCHMEEEDVTIDLEIGEGGEGGC